MSASRAQRIEGLATRHDLVLLAAALSLAAGLAAPLEAAGGQALMTVTPCRVLDTRNPAGPLGGPAVAPGEVRIVPVAGTCGVPANALGVIVNLTVASPPAPGFARLYAGDEAVPPLAQVLAFSAGRTRASIAFVALAAGGAGTVALLNDSWAPANFVLDVSAYFVPACTSTILVTNPATTTGTVNTAFSQTFTATGGTGALKFSTASPLPQGLTLSTGGVLSGTPTQPGTFPITVTATDANGCTGSGATYTLVIACQTIGVTNPVTATGTANTPFSQTFTSAGGVGTVTYSTVSALPAGLSLASNGTLSGTPTQAGGFDIVVTATDANGCAGPGPTYHLVINCQSISVTNPGVTAGTVNAPFSQAFTQSGAIGTATFTTLSTLPAGLTLATNGTLSGTPTQTGTFPVAVTVTDANHCTGTNATYNLVVNCQTIAVTNPGVSTATAGTAFSQTFTQAGAFGSATFTTASALPTGLTLATNGVLSGTPAQTGTFPITVVVTDANGCAGLSASYTLVVSCQAWSVLPAAIPQASTGVLYTTTFTNAGGIGAVTYAITAGAPPTGILLSSGGVLSGSTAQTGSFPITVTATDANGCTASRDYLLVVACSGSSITLSPPSLPTVVSGTAFPSTVFTASGGTGPYTFAKAGVLPAGMNFDSLTGTIDGTPGETGSFPITISATDSVGGCVGSQDYVVNVTCEGVTITVAPATIDPAPAGGVFPTVTFSASGSTGPYTFTEAGALPSGMSFVNGVLSGTPGTSGTFPITVTARDAGLCVGSTSTSLVITCPVITVTNPGVTTGTVSLAFSQTFTQAGGALPVTYSLASGTLPAGLTLDPSTGVLSGTPTQSGTFDVTVRATDANGCTGAGATYHLVIACQTITVTNPVGTAGIDGAAFSQTFTQSGAVGTATFSLASGSLPGGWNLSAAGVLSNPAPAAGSFSITVKVTDVNGCTGTSATYTVAIAPVATDDTYAPPIVGNMSIDTATGTVVSVLTNDTAGAAATLATPAAHGTVVLSPAGTFTYAPDRGYEGPDSFTYTVTKNLVTSGAATVSLNVTGVVWFVDNNSGVCVASCDGRRSNPYTTLAAFVADNGGAAPNPKSGHRIFLFESATPYTGPAAAPVALLDNQVLVGQDYAGTFAAATGFTVPDTTVGIPVLTPGVPLSSIASVAGQNIVALASGNTIRGLTLSATNNAALAFVGPGSLGAATVDAVSFALAGAGSGISLAGHAGTLTVQNGAVGGGGAGTAVAVSGAANGSVVFTNTAVSRTGGRLLDVQSRTGGAVTFDAASPLAVTGAATDGIVLQNNASTTLSLLGGISVTTTAGNGFFANSTGTVTIGGASNLINATGGAALDVTATTIAGSPGFTSVSSTNPSAQGILLSSVSGGLTIGTTTVSGTGTQRILVTGSTLNAAFGNTTLNGGTDAVSLQNNSSGTRSFGTLTIGNVVAPSGVGFLHAVGGGTTSVSGATNITNTSANGVDIQNSTTGVTFTGVTITKTSGVGVSLASNSGAVTFGALSVSSPASGSGLVSSGSSVNTSGGTIAVTGGPAVSAATTNFNSSSLASVSSTNSAGAGVSLTTCTGSLTVGGGSITGATGIPFAVTGGTVWATYGGGITQSASNPIVSVSGGHSGTITFQTGTLSATNGTGLQFDNADGVYNFNGATTLNGGDAGIDILNGSAGTFSFGSGTSITSPSGIAFNLASSAPNVTYAGTITQNNAQFAVSATSVTGGTQAFSGAIASTSPGKGVSLTSNAGGTFAFTGGLSLSTGANPAFTATGGGTVTATQNNTSIVNTLTTTTGTALNVANTTIGAAGLTFRSISANGATNGIQLASTGSSGGLTVAGTGTANSGGTIQNTTGDGISLDTTSNVSLNEMNIQSTAHSGVKGTLTTNFSFTNGTINNSGTAQAAGDSNIAFNKGAYAPTIGNEKNLTGTVTITANTLTNAWYHGVDIYQFDGTISILTLSNNTLTSSASTSASKGSAIRVVGFGSAGTVASVSKGTISQNTITNFPSDAGILFLGGNATSTGAPAGTYGTDLASNAIAITGNVISGQSTANQMGTQGINTALNGRGSGFFVISNNSITNVKGLGIGFASNGFTTYTGSITGNTIVAHNIFGSAGIGGGTTSTFSSADVPVLNLGIGDGTPGGANNISQTNGNGILVNTIGATSQTHVRIRTNTVAAPTAASGTTYGIRVSSGNLSSANETVCLEISGNTTAGDNDGAGTIASGIGLRKQGTNAAVNAFGIVGLPAGSTSSPAVENYVNSQNPGSVAGSFGVGGTTLISATSGFSTCVEPGGF